MLHATLSAMLQPCLVLESQAGPDILRRLEEPCCVLGVLTGCYELRLADIKSQRRGACVLFGKEQGSGS